MEITHIDSYPVNDTVGATVEVAIRRVGASRPLQLSTTIRSRAATTPAFEAGHYQQVEQQFEVVPLDANSRDEVELGIHLHEVFLPSTAERVLTAVIDEQTYQIRARVVSFGWSNFFQWQGTFQFVDPFWYAATPVVVSSFSEPITVTGNVPALPLLTFTGGDSVIRQRVTYLDRTGHGVSAYMVTVAPDEDELTEANYAIYANGLSIPFELDSGRLYFRIDCPPPPDRTYVDIYQGASINNTVTAGRLDPAGLTLAASLASGTVEADTDAAISNPLAPSLAWHPSITYRHESRRPYVYGLDGSEIVMIESDVARDVVGLADDVDSYVIVTGVEAERIRNLNLTIQAGYQPSQQEAAEDESQSTVMRVVIRRYPGWGMGAWEGDWLDWRSEFGLPHTSYHMSLTLGATTFPELFTGEVSGQVSGGDPYTRTQWWNEASVEDFAAVIKQYIGYEPTTGDPGVYYLRFAQPPPEHPLMSMSLQALSGSGQNPFNVEETWNIRGNVPVVIFESMWVDPVTLEPLDSNPETSDLLPDPIRGMARAVVKYRTRDSEHWITAWSREVVGSGPSGTSVSLSGLNIATPNAVEIAIGLEPVAARASNADWGRLEITSVPTIDLVNSRTPSATVSSPIEAQQINETIRNVTTGARVQLVDYLCDGGLEVDTANLQIRGAGGVGPTYGELKVNRGAAMFELRPGENAIEATDDDVTLTYSPRLAV